MTDYISKKGIQKALIDLPADLDAKTVQRCIETVHNFPAADVREVVYCRDCKWTKTDGMDDPAIYCAKWDKWEMPNDGFCWFGRLR